MKPFRLHEPSAPKEAAALLAQESGAAALYAGGTELLLAMKAGLLAYDALINVKSVAGLDAITIDDGATVIGAGATRGATVIGVGATRGAVVIGAGATHSAVERDPLVRERLPLLAEVTHSVANARVRNVGTLAGNLCFAEPHSDPAALLLVYEAEVDAQGPAAARRIPMDALQTNSYETSLAPDEIVTAVRVPPLPAGMSGAYSKFGRHHRPTLGIAAAVAVADGLVTDVRLAVGCVSPVARRLSRSEDVLRGERADEIRADAPALREACRLAAEDAEAVADLHGEADYKEHLTRVFLERTLLRALARNGSGGDA